MNISYKIIVFIAYKLERKNNYKILCLWFPICCSLPNHGTTFALSRLLGYLLRNLILIFPVLNIDDYKYY